MFAAWAAYASHTASQSSGAMPGGPSMVPTPPETRFCHGGRRDDQPCAIDQPAISLVATNGRLGSEQLSRTEKISPCPVHLHVISLVAEQLLPWLPGIGAAISFGPSIVPTPPHRIPGSARNE